jgi:hypothetical protein
MSGSRFRDSFARTDGGKSGGDTMNARNRAEAAIMAATGVLFFAGIHGAAVSQTVTKASDGPELVRPVNVDIWPTVGTTMRMDKANTSLPWQFRQVAMEPGAYAEFVKTGRYPDGAMLAASFHSVKLDASNAPPLYHEDQDLGISIEVIDRSHPDGRRFYNFSATAKAATPLPAGNSCAACHNARGGFDGTFAQYYPLISSRLPPR